jgi:hypothetical protein
MAVVRPHRDLALRPFLLEHPSYVLGHRAVALRRPAVLHEQPDVLAHQFPGRRAGAPDIVALALIEHAQQLVHIRVSIVLEGSALASSAKVAAAGKQARRRERERGARAGPRAGAAVETGTHLIPTY